MPWHAPNKDDAEGPDDEDEESQQYRPTSKKINYAALEAIIGNNVDGNPKMDLISTAVTSASTASPPSMNSGSMEDGGLAAFSPRLRTATNPLLEKTVGATISPTKSLSHSSLSPNPPQNIHTEQEEEEAEVDDEEVDVDEEEEEVDWNEGNELW